MFIDVDSFKKINDQCGHLVGDGVLKAIAQVLAHNVRITDFVARYG
jgi:diguanylate cyclase (GGDEF)-like protein